MLPAWLAGWALGLLLPVPPPLWILPFCLIALWLGRKQPLLVALAILPLAATWQVYRTAAPNSDDPSHLAPLRWARLEGRILSAPRWDGTRSRFEVSLSEVVAPFPKKLNGVVDASLDRECELRPGDRIRCEGRLTLPKEGLNFGPQGTSGHLTRLWIERIEAVRAAHSPLDRIRSAIFHRLTGDLPSHQGRLLGSIVFGSSAFPVFSEERERYTLVGLAHILAASGLQVSLLLGVFALPLARGHRLTGCLVGGLAIGGYLFLAGESPSILRAALMGGGTLLGIFFRRPLLAYVSLWSSALLLLVWEPSLLRNLGFQFSFLATWALLHTMPRIAARLPFQSFINQALASIFAVTLWVMPLQLHQFGTATPYGALANLVASPLVDGITILGFASIPLSFIPGLGPLVSRLDGGLITGLDHWVSLLLSLPGSHFCFHFPLALLAFSYGCLLLFFLLPKDRGWLWTPMLLLGIILALAPHPAEAYFLSVGQGDAIAIRTHHDHWILVDAGPSGKFDAGEKIIVPFLRRMGCNRIDLLVLTHPHQDHQGGLSSLLRTIPVARAWESGLSDPLANSSLAEFLLHGIPFGRPQPGETFELDGVTLRNLSPLYPLSDTRSDVNNSSLVLRLETKPTKQTESWKVLLAGDAERELEEWLLRHPGELKADVLKVAHHGSRFGSTQAFLQAVQPSLGILSVGPNPFKQPNGETLSRLRSRMRTMRTDEGAIRLSFGESLKAENSRGEAFNRFDLFDFPAHPW